MAEPLDDLFGGGQAPPPPPPRDRLTLVYLCAVAGFLLGVLGPCCFTGVPGAGLCAWGWYRADEELARLEAGDLPRDREAGISRARNLAFAGLVISLLLLVLQIGLFAAGVYEQYGQLLQMGLGLGAPSP